MAWANALIVVIAVVALLTGSFSLDAIPSPSKIVNPTGLRTNNKLTIKEGIVAFLISDLVNILNGLSVLLVIESLGIKIPFFFSTIID